MCISCNDDRFENVSCKVCGSAHHCDAHCPVYFTEPEIFSFAAKREGTYERRQLLLTYPPGSPQLESLDRGIRFAYRLGLTPQEEAEIADM